jgi:hypothetical protein
VFDLDDVGAPIREDRACCGHEGELCDLEDPDALHHLDHETSLPDGGVERCQREFSGTKIL